MFYYSPKYSLSPNKQPTACPTLRRNKINFEFLVRNVCHRLVHMVLYHTWELVGLSPRRRANEDCHVVLVNRSCHVGFPVNFFLGSWKGLCLSEGACAEFLIISPLKFTADNLPGREGGGTRTITCSVHSYFS